jgi:hypothetical protein
LRWGAADDLNIQTIMNEAYTLISGITTINSDISIGLLAYIDPGTGSFLIQMLLAGLLSVTMVFRNVRRWVFEKVACVFGSKRPGAEVLRDANVSSPASSSGSPNSN